VNPSVQTYAPVLATTSLSPPAPAAALHAAGDSGTEHAGPVHPPSHWLLQPLDPEAPAREVEKRGRDVRSSSELPQTMSSHVGPPNPFGQLQTPGVVLMVP
jgi:hypothetical protein